MRRATPKSLWRTKSEYPESSCLAFYAMLATSNALRLHVESALAGRVASPFRFQEPQPITASTGISAVDQLAGVSLRRLLWVRCRNVDQALRSVDLLLHGGGFSLVAVDLSGAPARLVRQVPLSFWFRLRRTVENTSTILLLLSRESSAKTCASLVLRMEREAARWSLQDCQYPSGDFHTPGSLLDGWTTTAEIIRSTARRKNVFVIGSAKAFDNSAAETVRFDLRSNYFLPDDSAD